MGLALEIARRSNALQFESFPAEALRWAKVAITDTIGCALAGAREETARIALAVASDGESSGACTVLGTKFSLPYAIARALVDGRVSLEHFEGSAWTDPAIRTVMRRVTTEAHDDDDNDYGAEVSVELASGETLTKSIDVPLGHGPRSPLTESMLRAKFVDCATRALPEENARDLFALLQSMETLASIRTLTAKTAVRADAPEPGRAPR